MVKILLILLLCSFHLQINGQDQKELFKSLNISAQAEIMEAYQEFSSHFNINTYKKIIKEVALVAPSYDCAVALNKLVSVDEGNLFEKLQLFDSIGKPPSGLFLSEPVLGNFFFKGEHKQCIDKANGKYGLLNVITSSILPDTLLALIGNGAVTTINVGVCVPTICDQETINKMLDLYKASINSIINIPQYKPIFIISMVTDFQAEKYPLSQDSSAIAAIVIISILLFFAFVGTLLDLIKVGIEYFNTASKNIGMTGRADMKFPKSTLIDVFMCFSVYTNSRKLFTIKKGGSEQLDFLNGIRFLSTSWVITGHTFFFAYSYPKLFKNGGDLFESYFGNFWFFGVSNAYFSVDSFFLLSGFLGTYLFIKEVKKNGLRPLLMVKYYIHRLWRITPPYMLTLMFVSCLSGQLISGPNFNHKNGVDPNCKTEWWANLLYINNLRKEQCFGHSWYLGNDMQFHFLAPIVLIPLALGSRIQYKLPQIFGITLTVILIFVNFIVLYHLYDANPGSEYGNNGIVANILAGRDSRFFDKIYIKPWARMGPFLIGILYGYLLSKFKNVPEYDYIFKKVHKIVTPANLLGWMISIALIGLEIFVIYGPQLNTFTPKPWPRINHIMYETTQRTVWAIALGFMIFSCAMGKGGFINDILSWTVWIPLARLSFAAYLIHPLCLNWYLASRETQIYFDDLEMIYLLMGNLFTTYLGAFLVSMLFEVPILGLEKFVFPKKSVAAVVAAVVPPASVPHIVLEKCNENNEMKTIQEQPPSYDKIDEIEAIDTNEEFENKAKTKF